MKSSRFFTSRNIAFLAVLLALVIVLQIWASAIPLGATRISLTLIPIVLGAVLLGPAAGAFLGAAFGIVVVVVAVAGGDPFTLTLLSDHPALTVLLCLVKGAAAGAAAGLLFRLVRKKNEYAAVFAAALSAPVVNTGLFILGALLMSDTIGANFVADGTTVLYFLVIGCAGLNFVVEFIVNAVASPAIYTVERLIERRVLKGKKAAPKQDGEPPVQSAMPAQSGMPAGDNRPAQGGKRAEVPETKS